LTHRRAPRRHEDAAAILGLLLGYSEERQATLTAEGAFGADFVERPTSSDDVNERSIKEGTDV